MNKFVFGLRPCLNVLAFVILLPVVSSQAANDWNTTTSGLWRTAANWSLATPPSNRSNENPTQITNAVSKTVTIDSATTAGNLSVRGLTISAPVGSTNILALVNVVTPLTTSNPFLVGTRGVLAITNANISPADSFDILNGAVILDSGSLTCGVNCDLQSGSLIVNSGTLTATLGTTGIRLGRFAGASANLLLNGGTVNALRVTLGSVSGSQTSFTLAGGNLICADSLSLAQLPATTGNATMTAGNLIVTNGTTKIADRATATFVQSGGTAAFADLSIGDLGVGTYNLSGGAFTVTPRTNTDLTIIGNLENGDFNQSGGIAIIRGEIHVADFGGVIANLNLTGGQFFATNDLIAIGREGTGSLTVSNAFVVLTNTSVGRHLGSSGIMTVQTDASVSLIADLSLGRLAGAFGQLLVNGGSLSITNDDIWVGRGGSGDMTVSGGTVRAKNLHVGSSDDGTNAPSGTLQLTGGNTLLSAGCSLGTSGLSSGSAVMSGGNLIATNSLGNASLIIADGTFTFNQGTIVADTLVMTNATGQFAFNHGLLRAKAMTVSNGQPFTVGDGLNPATLELQGGTYTFANGLVISPNATVTGCGTIIGNVIKHGTYNNPCGSSSPTVTISSLSRTGNIVTVFFPTLTGSNHILEFKTNLASPTWTAIAPGVIGNGSVMSKIDPAATNAARFYRIKVQ